MERKLFTALQGDGVEQLNNSLSQQGLPPVAKRAVPAVLFGMLRLPVGAN